MIMTTSSSSSSSQNALISFVLGASSAIALTYILAGDQRKKSKSRNSSKQRSSPSSLSSSSTSGTATSTTTPAVIPQHLREEQLSRHALYFGDDGISNIRSAKVCVVGLGGVGSHTAIMLARGGVETLRLIDFDQVTLSSLNRHACATLQDVGIPKVTCVQTTCHALGVPNVDARVEMYTAANGPTLLELDNGNTDNNNDKWDLVIDCIDDVPTKAALLSHCIQHKIRVFSCMGAGGKSDMTRLHISDLRTAAKDPLASKLRTTMKRQIKKEKKIEIDETYLDDMDQLTIIHSSEKPVVKLADFTDEQKQEGDKSQFGAVDGMRVRVLPVLGPMPAIMGQSLASMALCELGKKPILQPVTGERIGRNVRNKLYQHLQSRENKIASGQIVLKDMDDATLMGAPLEIANEDVDYIMGVWRNRCAVTGARLGTVLAFARWDMTKPATSHNLVLMSTHALKAYDEKGKASIPADVQKRIEERLAASRDLNCDL